MQKFKDARAFYSFVLEEKISYIYPVVEDILRLHAAFSEAIVEGKETELVLHYSPEDTLSPSSFYFYAFMMKYALKRQQFVFFLQKKDQNMKFYHFSLDPFLVLVF